MPAISHITVGGIPIEVTKKRVKYLRIKVNRSSGNVRITSPWLVGRSTIYRFAESKLPWIKKHLESAREKEPAPVLKYGTGEVHRVWGEPCAIKIIEKNGVPGVILNGSDMLEMNVRPDSNSDKRKKLLQEWYRAEIKSVIPGFIKKWEPEMGVSVKDWGVKKMKTRWGTCNTQAGRIWLNLELAKHPPEVLEYIVVHEMNHLLERLHTKRFYSLMDRFMPEWRKIDKKLGGKHWKK